MIKHGSLIPNFNILDAKTPFLFRNKNLVPSHLSMCLRISAISKQSIEFLSINRIILLGKIKTLAQNTWILRRTDDNTWSLPAKERFLTSQESVLAVILFTNDSQSIEESLLVSCVKTRDKLRGVHPIVSWWKLVWFPRSIHRDSFLLWVVFHDALVTKKRMWSWGYAEVILCPFCYGCLESQ